MITQITLPPYLTRAQVAQHFPVPVASLETYATRGGGPRITKIGRKVVYATADVVAWLESYRQAPTGGKRRRGRPTKAEQIAKKQRPTT